MSNICGLPVFRPAHPKCPNCQGSNYSSERPLDIASVSAEERASHGPDDRLFAHSCATCEKEVSFWRDSRDRPLQ